jgi:dihydroorotate dehydrogenase
LPQYDRIQTYEWNYRHAPEPVVAEAAPVPGEWRFCGKRVPSPLGVAAGPLLNGAWCLYYASLGFDVLTYKTVRSRARECYPLPNLQPVRCGSLHGGEEDLPAADTMLGSWAVSFGMPSQSPDAWRADVEETRARLSGEKLLSVSVVGSTEDGWTLNDLAKDYARCARWAARSGADCVETNFSCPNVATCDGQLYQHPHDAAVVAEQVRDAIGQLPYIVKIGHLSSTAEMEELLTALAPYINAVAMTNSVAATVMDSDGRRLFDGQKRGICGAATFEPSLEQVRMARDVIRRRALSIDIIGVGGASTSEHVRRYLEAGAAAVHIATAAMIDPGVALKIRSELGRHAMSNLPEASLPPAFS